MTTLEKPAKAGMKTAGAVRAQLQEYRKQMKELQATYRDERKEYFLQDVRDAISIGTIKAEIQEDGNITNALVPPGFHGPKEHAFNQVHREVMSTLRVQIETLEWVLGREGK
jgi:hypothetical protein